MACDGKQIQKNWPLRVAAGLSLLYIYSAFLPFEFRPDWWRPEIVRVLLLRQPFADRPPGAFGLTFSLSNSVVNFSAGLLLGWFAFLGFRRALGRWLAFPSALLLAFVVATTMEIVQVGVEGRVPTPTDICTITLGGTVGALLAAAAGGIVGRFALHRVVEPLMGSKRGLAFTLLVAFLVIRSLFPTSVSANFGEVLDNAKRANILPFYRPGVHLAVQLRVLGFDVDDRPYRHERFWHELTPVRYGFNMAGHALFYLGIAVALASLVERRVFRDTVTCALGTGGLGLAVEGLQLFLPSQCSDINVVLIALGAGLIGPLLWRFLRRRPKRPAAVGALAVVLYAATQYLNPGTGAGARGLSFWDFVPIYHMERSSHRIGLLLNIFECFAPYVLFGWAIAELSGAQKRPGQILMRVVLACVLVAAGFEIAQAWVSRVPSIDGVVFAAVGGACGVWLGRRVAADRGSGSIAGHGHGADRLSPKPAGVAMSR